MLIKVAVLERIRAGEITHLYRRWKRAAAKAEGRQRTPVGELAVVGVEAVELSALGEEDVRQGGFESLQALHDALSGREGTVYRIEVRYEGADPRVARRDDVSPEAVAEVVAKLARKDARAGAWTTQTLAAIGAEPGRRAADLAEAFGLEKLVFKRRVRQLKELGLTESLKVGYRLSPRGEAVLAALG